MSDMHGYEEADDVPSHSLSIVSVSAYMAGQGKREKKVNNKFIGSPWTPDGRGRRRRTKRSQFFVRSTAIGYSPVLTLDPMAAPDETEAVVFDAWYHNEFSAYKASTRRPYLLNAHERLDFTVSVAEMFDFWFRLRTSNEWLTDEEVEVLLYYTRQKQVYVPKIFDMRATCGSCHLNTFFCAQYDEFKRLKKAGERWKDIQVIQFLQGGLWHGIRCHDVDTVYMPINQPNEHWFIAAVKLNEWSIHILDLLYTARRKQARMNLVRPLAEMLPDALADVGFFDVWEELKQYKGSPFSLKYEKKYPQQDGTDCGLFMVKFIEFLMTKGLDIRDCVQDKMDAFCYHSYVQLFTHGCRKRADIYCSDDE